MQEVFAIAAATLNGIVGATDGQGQPVIPFKSSADKKFFKHKTQGCALVVGRKTFESMQSKALPGRPMIVVSSQDQKVAHDSPDEVFFVRDVKSAIVKGLNLGLSVAICGGHHVWLDGLAYCTRAYINIVHTEVDGDTYFPHLGPAELIDLAEYKANPDKGELGLTYLTLVPRPGGKFMPRPVSEGEPCIPPSLSLDRLRADFETRMRPK